MENTDSPRTSAVTAPVVPASAQPHVERARKFLREIRDAIASHPVASRNSRVQLQERRSGAATVVRMTGTLDGVLVSLLVEIHDSMPQHAQMEYSRSLERLRTAPMMTPAASAFTVVHDRAMQAIYPERETGREALRVALEEFTQNAARRAPVH